MKTEQHEPDNNGRTMEFGCGDAIILPTPLGRRPTNGICFPTPPYAARVRIQIDDGEDWRNSYLVINCLSLPSLRYVWCCCSVPPFIIQSSPQSSECK